LQSSEATFDRLEITRQLHCAILIDSLIQEHSLQSLLEVCENDYRILFLNHVQALSTLVDHHPPPSMQVSYLYSPYLSGQSSGKIRRFWLYRICLIIYYDNIIRRIDSSHVA